MQPLKRTGASCARRLRPQVQRQSRRHASDSHGHDSHGSHDAHHAVPANESFGSGFYICIAAIPASFALYKFSRQGTDEQPYFTRVITDTYNGYKTKWAERNASHTQAMEQAAADRVLFLNEGSRSLRRVDIKFPEIFNTGSPWNVPAGHGSANLDNLIAKYEKEAFEENEKKLQQLKDNNVPVEKPFESFRKLTPAANDS